MIGDDYDIDEEYGHLATEQDSCREYTVNVGRENSDRAWILSPYDTWEKNPFYDGPPVKHPEDYDYEDEDEIAEDPTGPKV